MDDFATVYIFTQSATPAFRENTFNIKVGIIVLAIGLVGLLFILIAAIIARSKDASTKNYILTNVKNLIFSVLFVIGWGGIWLFFNIPGNDMDSDEYSRLQAVYNSHQYKVAEGIVYVLHTQPASGHDDGDIIKVGNVELEVNAYAHTFGYKTTIAKGGILTDGTYARVYYDPSKTASGSYLFTILRIDIMDEDNKPDSTPSP